MSSRFVSGGTIPGHDGPEPPNQSAQAATNTPSQSASAEQPSSTSAKQLEKNAEWEAVQKHLDDQRREREAARRAAAEGTGGQQQSLYEVLQANKEAKQAAFEEANKIKNQFRALDDDEIDFLDGVLEDERRERERVQRETDEGLAAFRKAQKSGDKATGVDDGGVGEEEGEQLDMEWLASGGGGGRKRKRERDEKGIKGLKRRTSSSTSAANGMKAAEDKGKAIPVPTKEEPLRPQAAQQTAAAAPKPKPSLVAYGSDDDDDDD